MAGGKTDYAKKHILDAYYGGTAYAVPATLYLLALTGTNTQAQRSAGTMVEVSATGYARVAITNNGANWSAAAGALTISKTNAIILAFAAAVANWGTVTAVAIADALTAGNILAWFDLLGTEVVATVATSGIVTAPAHGFVLTNKVKFSSLPGVAVPGGLTDGAYYFVIATVTTDTFQLSLTSGGAAITITSSGGGKLGLTQEQTVNAGGTFSIGIGALLLTEL